jgi:hypothetical protein
MGIVTGVEVSVLGTAGSETGVIILVSPEAGLIETFELTIPVELVELVVVLESLIMLLVGATSFIRKLIVNNYPLEYR